MQEQNAGVVKTETSKSEAVEYLGKVRNLVHEGQGRGFVTHQDIERHIPVDTWNPDMLDNILNDTQVRKANDKLFTKIKRHVKAKNKATKPS